MRKKEPFAGGAGTYEGRELKVALRSGITMFAKNQTHNAALGGVGKTTFFHAAEREKAG
jgi:hypothetical protein